MELDVKFFFSGKTSVNEKYIIKMMEFFSLIIYTEINAWYFKYQASNALKIENPTYMNYYFI